MADVLDLPDRERALVTWMMRREVVAWPDVVAHIGDEVAARALFAALTDRGFVRETVIGGETSYRVRVVERRKRQTPVDLWRRLDDTIE